MAAKINKNDCIGCNCCAGVCPFDAITFDETATIDPDKCTECGCCANTCPTGALTCE
ncbi:MAG: 4Fe-4S binding protein [Erysipelotrichaceae bacterium]|nr:4Fe-4S binding protein [Erysipelotrichaceae bacterium]